MTYRDPLAGLRGQIAVKRTATTSKSAQVPATLRALLPAALAARIAALEAEGAVADDALGDADLARLSAVDSALDALSAAFEEALTLAPTLKDCPDAPPDPPWPELPEPWLNEDPPQLDLRRAIAARVLGLDADSFLRRWGDFAYLSRLRVEGVRVVFMFSLRVTEIGFTIDGFRASLRATIPRAFPELHLRPQKTLDALKKSVGLARELDLGEPTLDDAYFVTGDRRALPLVSVPRVRSALGVLARFDGALHAEGGVLVAAWGASLGSRWRGGPEVIFPDAALDLVLGARRALTE